MDPARESTMHNHTKAILATCLVVALAGCNRHDADDAATTAAADTTATAPADTTATEPAPAAEPVASGGTLVLGGTGNDTYLTDSSGRALYVLKDDDDGTKCVGDCMKTWPAVTTVTTAGVPEIQGPMIGTVTRSDGTTQVTYYGHPLYYYSGDTTPGTLGGMNVNDSWGTWYLVRPSGETFVLEEGVPTTTSPTAAGADARELPTQSPGKVENKPSGN